LLSHTKRKLVDEKQIAWGRLRPGSRNGRGLCVNRPAVNLGLFLFEVLFLSQFETHCQDQRACGAGRRNTTSSVLALPAVQIDGLDSRCPSYCLLRFLQIYRDR